MSPLERTTNETPEWLKGLSGSSFSYFCSSIQKDIIEIKAIIIYDRI